MQETKDFRKVGCQKSKLEVLQLAKKVIFKIINMG